MNPITVLLAEDHTMVRKGLRALLQPEADIEIVGEAANGRQAVVFCSTLCPHVVVMDLAMPLLSGLNATLQIRQTNPSTKVLILSSYDDEAYVEEARAMGASGYIVKQSAAELLPRAIREIHQGHEFFMPIKAPPVEYP